MTLPSDKDEDVPAEGLNGGPHFPDLKPVRAQLESVGTLPARDPPVTHEEIIDSIQANSAALHVLKKSLVIVIDHVTETGDAAKKSYVALRDIKSKLGDVSERVRDSGVVVGRECVGLLNHTELINDRTALIITKLEVVTSVAERTDDAVVKLTADLRRLQHHVSDHAVDIERVKEHVSLLPAIRDMLVEIMSRLPAPAPAPARNS